MPPTFPMLVSVAEALEATRRALRPRSTVTLPLASALGAYLAAP
ncbi:hypothetical protein ACFP81_03055 [Deinococcus lacus]|uniref:Uncharacterized protein n=1 Tax=Deinococcus lacus TaxID=392561 RepID=A0ABW1YAW1_9DEIO